MRALLQLSLDNLSTTGGGWGVWVCVCVCVCDLQVYTNVCVGVIYRFTLINNLFAQFGNDLNNGNFIKILEACYISYNILHCLDLV